MILVLTISELFFITNIQWAIPSKYYDNNDYNKLSQDPINDLKNAFLSNNLITVTKGNLYFRNQRKFNINYFDVFGIEKHTKIFDNYFNRNGTYKKNISEFEKEYIDQFFALDKESKRIFFSKNINHKDIFSFIDDVNQTNQNHNINIFVDIEKYNGDQISIEVFNNIDGYITYIDNWSPGWLAELNNNRIKIDKLFDTYKSIKLNKGNNKIFMKYEAWK